MKSPMIIPSDHWVKDSPNFNRQDYPTVSKLVDRDDDFLLTFLMGPDDQITFHNWNLRQELKLGCVMEIP